MRESPNDQILVGGTGAVMLIDRVVAASKEAEKGRAMGKEAGFRVATKKHFPCRV